MQYKKKEKKNTDDNNYVMLQDPKTWISICYLLITSKCKWPYAENIKCKIYTILPHRILQNKVHLVNKEVK